MFRALIAALGVSARHNYDMNSLAVPRKAKEVGEGGGGARGGGGESGLMAGKAGDGCCTSRKHACAFLL